MDKKRLSIDKKWLVVIAAVVVVILIVAIPLGFVWSMHRSVYDCSFEYVEVDDLLREVAKKHTYYNAMDKTVEVQLHQDLINSQIKDYLGTLDLGLPENVSIAEVMFNAKDQRVYVNAKYGNLNVPLSAKINVDLSDAGMDIVINDLKLGNRKAPGFIRNQFSEEMLKYTVKYGDLGVPQVFTVKDVKFSTGILKATVRLHEDKIVDMAMDYRKDLMNDIDRLKEDQVEVVHTFVDRLLETGVLSEENTKEYVKQVLNNEELVNSALQFAAADDLGKYAGKLREVQEDVAAWAAPLQVVGYYGNVDDTINTILSDEEFNEFMTWFMPKETIDEYAGFVRDYYAQYANTVYTFESVVAGIDTGAITEYTDQVLAFAAQAEEGKKISMDMVAQIDAEAVKQTVEMLEQDRGFVGDSLTYVDPYYINLVKANVDNLEDTKALTQSYLQALDLRGLHASAQTVKQWESFIVKTIRMLQDKQYAEVYNTFAYGELPPALDLDSIYQYNDAFIEQGEILNDFIVMLQNQDL